MKLSKGMLGLLAITLYWANPVFSLPGGSASADDAAMDQTLEAAMTPGDGQKKLNTFIGTFDVRIRTWVASGSEPVQSTASMVSAWVLGGRYVQSMLAGTVGGEPFNGIGYIGYDNVSRIYQTAWMDTGSTGMTWYTGGFDASGTSATLKASVMNPLTATATPVELRLAISPDGNHVTEMWGQGLGTEMFRMMELTYTRNEQ